MISKLSGTYLNCGRRNCGQQFKGGGCARGNASSLCFPPPKSPIPSPPTNPSNFVPQAEDGQVFKRICTDLEAVPVPVAQQRTHRRLADIIGAAVPSLERIFKTCGQVRDRSKAVSA